MSFTVRNLKIAPDQGGAFLPFAYCLPLLVSEALKMAKSAPKWRKTRVRDQAQSKTAGCMALKAGVEGFNQGGWARVTGQKVLLAIHHIGSGQVFDRICEGRGTAPT
jgi:hypothetical protein